MSGVEALGLVLGVLPLLIEAVKAYSTVSHGLHTFRHWSREVKSLSRQLKVHNGIFLNECRLLLRLVEDEQTADEMLEDEVNQRWLSKDLNDKFNSALEQNVDLCRSIIEETRNIVDDMEEQLKQFDTLKKQKQKNEKIKAAIQRLRGAISITFDKSKFEKCLSGLRDRNGDLSALRQQIGAFQQQIKHTNSSLVKHKTLPVSIQSIRSASQKLHEALCNAWCCDDAAHRAHYAKLCLDAEVENEVRLDLAISCFDAPTNENRALPKEPPIWLYVQSKSMTSDQYITTEPTITVEETPTLSLRLLASPATNSLKKKASEDLLPPSTCKKKARRVHFIGPHVDESPVAISVNPTTQLTAPDFDLSHTKNICLYLKRKYRTCKGAVSKNCVGYLETPQMYKHLFFARNDTLKERPYANMHTIFDVMGQDADDFLSVTDQIKLAHKTAVAVLQYNDTPWLLDRWRLSNMSYFGNRQKFDEGALKTIHLSSQISAPPQSNMTAAMDGIECIDAEISDEVRYGINNLPLFFLGVALLEIAHWTPLEKKMTARDANDQVFAARRLAAGRAPLGPEYQKIAQKCLQCNFGFGTQLSNKGLQAAVYNDVVGELEKMVERLSI